MLMLRDPSKTLSLLVITFIYNYVQLRVPRPNSFTAVSTCPSLFQVPASLKKGEQIC